MKKKGEVKMDSEETVKTEPVNVANVKNIIAEYDEKNLDVEDARKALNARLIDRSAVVKRLAHAIAPKKKIVREGKEFTVVVRGDNYFLRGASTDPEDVVSLD